LLAETRERKQYMKVIPVRDLVANAKRAYTACAHIEQEWITKELGEDAEAIQDALLPVMCPEQFATPWEKELYEALVEVWDDLDHKSFPRSHIRRLLQKFSQVQENRVETRSQMEAYSQNH
jgi:hypothetical protein